MDRPIEDKQGLSEGVSQGSSCILVLALRQWSCYSMNIILNSYCNLKCNYCFADEYMEENVKTPGKSMDYEFFTGEMLPRVKNVTLINFMGGEPTLHPRFNDMLSRTLDTMQPFTYLGVFTNGLMPEKKPYAVGGHVSRPRRYRVSASYDCTLDNKAIGRLNDLAHTADYWDCVANKTEGYQPSVFIALPRCGATVASVSKDMQRYPHKM